MSSSLDSFAVYLNTSSLLLLMQLCVVCVQSHTWISWELTHLLDGTTIRAPAREW